MTHSLIFRRSLNKLVLSCINDVSLDEEMELLNKKDCSEVGLSREEAKRLEFLVSDRLSRLCVAQKALQDKLKFLNDKIESEYPMFGV